MCRISNISKPQIWALKVRKVINPSYLRLLLKVC